MTDLQSLRDREDLRDTVLKFAAAVDTIDMALYRSVFAEECEYDLSALNGQPPVTVKAADWAAGIEPFLRSFDATQHLLANFVFDIRGDRAKVAVYVQAEHFLVNGQGDDSVTLGGTYDFGMARAPDGWRIDRFRLTAGWHRGNQGLYGLAGSGKPRR